MKVSELREGLHAMKIHNAHGIMHAFGVEGRRVYLSYRPAHSVIPDKTAIVGVGFKTNPAAAWYDHGCKTFGGNRRTSMPLAMACASEMYGITEWATCPLGGRGTKIPKEALDAARRAVREARGQQ